MPHDTPLITTIVVGFCLAFLFGIIAHRLRTSPLIGYLLAGIIVGPHTGGFHVDPELTNQLAEIGVILLMFGVGLHFSLKDLLSVKSVAVPGALGQMVVATLLGAGLGLVLGWDIGSSVVFGLALSTASTVVLLRALQERRLLETDRGRIAVGWLVVEDLTMILALVLVPALSHVLGGHTVALNDPIIDWLHLGIWGIVGLTIVKVIVFIAVMLIVGRRIIPWFLKITAQSGSRELFRLSVLAIALGVAFGAAHLFGVSLALGAFFAGMIMSESDLSHRAAEESLPLRDAFAVLFFVSVGMLFNVMTIINHPLALAATLIIIIIGKSLAAFWIVRLFRYPLGTQLTIAASLAQIGEFSFILASLGISLNLLDQNASDLILGGAILSILVNPLVFIAAEKFKNYLERKELNASYPQDIIDVLPTDEEDGGLVKTSLKNHTIIIGMGRVGTKVAKALHQAGLPVLAIEDAARVLENASHRDIEIIPGNAVEKDVLEAANLKEAKQLVIAMRNTFESGQIVAIARLVQPSLSIIAHAGAEAETKYLLELGANLVVTDDEEIAKGMITHLLGKEKSSQQNVTKGTGESMTTTESVGL